MENSDNGQLFTGSYQTVIDDKNRIELPEEFAELLKDCYISLGKHNSLYLTTEKVASQKMRQLRETLNETGYTVMGLDIIRTVAKSITIMKSDNLNRYKLPLELAKRVGIRSGDTVCITGKGDYLELRLYEQPTD